MKIRCYSFVKFLCLSFGFSSKLHFCRLAHTLALYSAHASTHTVHHHHHPPPAAATLIGIETDSTTTTTSIREQQSGCQPASIPRNSSKTFIASQLYGIEIVAATNRWPNQHGKHCQRNLMLQVRPILASIIFQWCGVQCFCASVKCDNNTNY